MGATRNILTLDVEDYAQSSPQALRAGARNPAVSIDPGDRILGRARKLLKILAEHNVRATCFILGSVAEKYPELVREIHGSGHEVASHGYLHRPVYLQQPAEFRADVLRARKVLGGITGTESTGYRAPYFSITRRSRWALEVLAEAGVTYDASILPVHSRYYRVAGWDGADDCPRFPHELTLRSGRLLEFPATTLRVAGQNLPVAGGVFLHFLPYRMFARAITQANSRGQPAVFYLHPHDLYAEALPLMVRAQKVRLLLQRWFERRLHRLLADFSFTSIHEWRGGAPAHISP